MESRCYFVTVRTCHGRRLFQLDSRSRLLLHNLADHRRAGRFQLHAFVVMPDHLHLILTPAPNVPLERAVQFIKGRFTHDVRREFAAPFENWQTGFYEIRLAVIHEFRVRERYIENNPVRARLCSTPEEFRWSSIHFKSRLDPPPPELL